MVKIDTLNGATYKIIPKLHNLVMDRPHIRSDGVNYEVCIGMPNDEEFRRNVQILTYAAHLADLWYKLEHESDKYVREQYENIARVLIPQFIEQIKHYLTKDSGEYAEIIKELVENAKGTKLKRLLRILYEHLTVNYKGREMSIRDYTVYQFVRAIALRYKETKGILENVICEEDKKNYKVEIKRCIFRKWLKIEIKDGNKTLERIYVRLHPLRDLNIQ